MWSRLALDCLAFMALVDVALPAMSVYADPLRCQQTIAAESARFARKRLTTLRLCADRFTRGVIAGPCPDDTALSALAAAERRLRESIDKRCGGKDRMCGSGDDETLAAIGWDVGTCPGFESFACHDPIGDCAAVDGCLECVGDAAVGEAVELGFADLPADADLTPVAARSARRRRGSSPSPCTCASVATGRS